MEEAQIGEAILAKLSRGMGEAEYELDLTGLDLPHARESVARMLEWSRFRTPRAIAVRLDPPVAGGGETLFQPIGRLLLEARRSEVLSGLSPLPPESGIGFRIETVGNPEAHPEEDTPERDTPEKDV